ncbi:MAG: M28 family peptidase, partial [Sinomicrobium sp.]|nr:M28 family peptidase [Sinomicrobium sp.]
MKRYSPIISLLLILGGIYWTFYSLMPQNYSKENTPPDQFAAERALTHVRTMSRQPHYAGSPYHKEVQKYIVEEFEKLGLYTQLQEGYTFDKWKTLSTPQNIITRIKGTGNGEAVLLLAHYDSSPHSSLGASDDASGTATIMEGVRAFIASSLKPKNDIIILISDAEELGLSGAELFVKKHPWAKDVRVILNFEARGSGGPSYMFIETNGGNAKMVAAFKKADVKFPAATSLAYSIYKMLPNDTDLTVFREEADINGFNFAFIDDHFDYHTVRDSYENLDKNTLEHQGAYLMPLLHYFAYADLNDLKSIEDDVYFNTPLGLYSYPFTWVLPLFILALILFGYLLYLGFKTNRLSVRTIMAGFAIFIVTLIFAPAVTYYGWQALLKIYPQYNEILHGFPYNGHWYIAAFIVFTLGVCFTGYSWFKSREHLASYTVAPLFIWLIINGGIALYLKGAAFFIIPVYFSLLLFYFVIKNREPNSIALTLL